MRTKALLCLAALAASAASVVAQNVYSLNVVGYYNVTLPAGKYAMIANQMVTTDNTIPTLLAGVPANTVVLKWGGAGFMINNNDPDLGWDDPAMTLVPGEGAFVKNGGTADMNVTFVGEVNQNTNTLTFTKDVFKMVGLFTPQAGKLIDDFGFPAAPNDSVYRWGGNGYLIYFNDPDIGWDANPEVNVGEGFFVKSGDAKTWTRNFKVQ